MSGQSPIGAGKSSYDLIDADRFWKILPVTLDMTVLDLACGIGRYTLPMSAKVGPNGRVIAVDVWSEGIDQLRAAMAASGLKDVEPHVADATRSLPLASASVDLCLMATVLHDFSAEGSEKAVIAEVIRILKPEGVLAVVEFIKQDGPPGPPKEVRLSLGEISAKLQPFGLIRFGAVVELGQHLYYAHFKRL